MKLSEEKKAVVRVSVKSSAGMIIGMALKVPLGILSAWLLGPVNLGAFKVIGLILKYSSYNHLGLPSVPMKVRHLPLEKLV